MKQELDYYWKLGSDHDYGTESCLIYKVQQHIRDMDRFSYEPCIVSIGPYHHGSASTLGMEKVKWGYLDVVTKLNCHRNLLDYLTEIRGLAKQARNSYSEDIKMDDEAFLQMLLLDGCFILCSLGGVQGLLQDRQAHDTNAGPEATGAVSREQPEQANNEITEDDEACQNITQSGSDDDVGYKQDCKRIGHWFVRFMNHDLLLLENQIPFFVVKKIFELVTSDCVSPPCLTDALAKYVEAALRFYPKATMDSDRPKDFCHLLHLSHIYFQPSQRLEEDCSYQFGPRYIHRFLSFGRKYFRISYFAENNEHNSSSHHELNLSQGGNQLNRWRRAAQYIEAGVKFKKREYDIFNPHSLLDIMFSNGVMDIPCLIVDEYTGSLFRNLIAFEQTCPQFGDDFTAYIVFLSQLVSMPEDVTLLVQRQIIVHHLDSDERVSDLFTLLSKDVVFDFNGNYYLKFLCQVMEAHYQSRINRWMAWLWLNHFSNPWMAVGAFATVIVLVCTIVQTIYGILAYVNPPE
ncbi:unnamed protein product [Urochloa humidicola]